MLTPVLSTKLYIPRLRPNAVSRPRLCERLDEGLHRKLILVSAPAGFGKTTLLSEWINRKDEGRRLTAEGGSMKDEGLDLHPSSFRLQPSQLAWLSLDEGDSDPARFLTYLVAAVQTMDAEIGKGVLDLLQSPQPPHTESILTTLLNEIATRPDHFVLVLDDYHVIDSTSVDQALSFLIEHLPPQMHLVIATREDPQLPLARLRARGQLTEVRATDLRFDPSEAAAFLNQAMGLHLSAEDIAALDARTEGWIAGLQLAAISLQGHADASRFVQSFTGSHHFVLDYLVEEVLQHLPEQVQAFLLRTSILARLCAPLCDAVLGKDEGGRMKDEEDSSSFSLQPSSTILEYLDRSNLFLIPIDDESRWYRYHHLFRDLLRSRLATGHPDLVAGLHLRASVWYAGQDDLEDAILHALAAGDYTRVADLVEQAAQRLDMQNKLVSITHWIDALPDERVRARPWLSVYRAWGYQWMGRREQVEAWLRAAERSILPAQPSGAGPELDAEQQHILGHVAAIRAHAALTGENIARVLQEGEKALAYLPDEDEMRCETAIAIGGAYWALGDVARSEQAFAAARVSALKCGHRTMAVPATCYTAMQQAKQARLGIALATYQDGLRMATTPDGNETAVAGFPNIRLGDVLRERNELDQAGQHLYRGIEQCIQLGQADVLVDGYICLARYQMTVGDRDGAQDSLRRADQVLEKTKVDPFVQCWLEDCRLRFWIQESNLPAVERWVEQSGLKAAGPFSYHYDLHHINLARALVFEGLRAPSPAALMEAADLLVRLASAADQAGWVQEKIKILVLLAIAHRSSGGQADALQELAQAIALAQPGGYVRLFVDEGAPMRLLISDFRFSTDEPARLHKPEIPNYAEKLLAAFPQPALTPQSEIDNQKSEIEPLSPRELEVLRLIAQGLSNQEIGERLFLALDTVKGHNRRIFDKLQVQRRTEAIARARELGLL